MFSNFVPKCFWDSLVQKVLLFSFCPRFSMELRFLNKLILPLFFFFFFFLCSSTISFKTTCLGLIRYQSFVRSADLSFQEIGKIKDQEVMENDMGFIIAVNFASRRLLSGPGSSPPRCTSKCGKCTPCKPVHVPVPPGTPVTAEYYPEAWRCKCGNKLYMPWRWCHLLCSLITRYTLTSKLYIFLGYVVIMKRVL